jgi:hypothetical protein
MWKIQTSTNAKPWHIIKTVFHNNYKEYKKLKNKPDKKLVNYIIKKTNLIINCKKI